MNPRGTPGSLTARAAQAARRGPWPSQRLTTRGAQTGLPVLHDVAGHQVAMGESNLVVGTVQVAEHLQPRGWVMRVSCLSLQL